MENIQELKGKAKSTLKVVFEVLEIILIDFALSWVVRSYVLEARIIPTGSMLPTIQLQDRIIVDKFFFKHFGELERGDIIVFHPPESAHSSEDFIKRLIALPGDTIEIKDHVTYINGEAIKEAYVAEPQVKNLEPTVVPEGYVFVMGDNRNDSTDSREWGFLPIENITGMTLFRYWPLNRFGLIN